MIGYREQEEASRAAAIADARAAAELARMNFGEVAGAAVAGAAVPISAPSLSRLLYDTL